MAAVPTWLWRGSGGGNTPSPDAGDVAASDSLDLATSESAVGGLPQPSSTSGSTDSILTADFPTIYEKTGTVGDPATDRLLAAFGEVANEDAAVRTKMMNMAMKAAGADGASVAKTLASRLDVLVAAVRKQETTATQRQSARATELKAVQEAATSEMEQLKVRLRELEQQLAAKAAATKSTNEADASSLQSFKVRVDGEFARLRTFLEFLNPKTAKK